MTCTSINILRVRRVRHCFLDHWWRVQDLFCLPNTRLSLRCAAIVFNQSKNFACVLCARVKLKGNLLLQERQIATVSGAHDIMFLTRKILVELRQSICKSLINSPFNTHKMSLTNHSRTRRRIIWTDWNITVCYVSQHYSDVLIWGHWCNS